MTLHPALQAMVDAAAALPAMQTLPVDAVRAGAAARYKAVPRPEVAHVEDRAIPGPRGPIPVRVYRPDLEPGRPVIVFFHGSGFVICSVETHDGLVRQLCRRSRMIVVSVDYALAPENKFPAAPEDCLAATRWVFAHARDFGGDPARIVLAGDSVGGTMSAVTAIRLRDAGEPAPRAMLLMYPVTDHPSAGMPSYTERGAGCGLTREGMEWFWNHYLQDAADGAHPHASPNRAEDLSRLPSSYVITAEYDPLRDEGKVFADRLQAAGNVVLHRRYADANHGFMSWVGLIDRSDEALQAACDWLKAHV
ncbi:alpha/beta hydrolase [Falsiroseomonas sp. HW251]|uniref:alpha/beta hydrolase n=1 Tax=Falsiroseomonas sp. HW251 TaxID=3390998 RepID=UPI003D31F8B1